MRAAEFSLLLAAALVAGGCSGKSSDAATADGKSASRADSAQRGGPGAGPGGGGGGDANTRRGGPSITLASTDVLTIKRTLVEESTPIAGDLHPIETIDVKARLEGDITSVYVREGERVRKGQLLARFEASEQESDLRSAEADRAAARGELATAQWNYEQSQELFKAGAIPERDHKAAEQSVTTARARLAAADARVRATSSFVVDTRVLSPTSGVVEKREIESGEHVSRGATMFTVVRNDVLELAASVPARRATGVRAGQTVYFNADGREFTGRVARVSPTIDPATRAITVYVQIPNTSGSLKGGTFASGRVVGKSAPNAIAIPSPAIRQGRDGVPYVYRIAGSVLEQRKVTLGLVDEISGLAEVRQGLAEGDRIVVGNVGTLGAGMQVQVVGAPEQKPGG